MCGPGPAVLGGAGAEEMGCARTDRWQSHLLTVQRCGTVRGGEGRREGRTGGEGEEGSEAGRQRVGELLTLGLPWE